MRYRNTKTGTVIDIESKLSGGGWEKIEQPAPRSKKKEKKDELRDDTRSD